MYQRYKYTKNRSRVSKKLPAFCQGYGQVSVHRITEIPVDVLVYEGYVCPIFKRDYISGTLVEIYHAFIHVCLSMYLCTCANIM